MARWRIKSPVCHSNHPSPGKIRMLTSPQAKPAECKPAIKVSSLMRDSKPLKYSVLVAIGIGVAFAVFFFGVTIAIIARAIATDNTGFEPDNPDFVLYKNSRFKECYNLAPDATNCSHIRSGISTHATSLAEGFGYVDNIHGWSTQYSADASSHPPIYDWCQIVSCFNGFKIIPSTARASATILPNIACWWTVMITSTSALWHTGKQLVAAFREDGKLCRGRKELSWIDWLFFAYDICGPILWWWVSFGQFAVDPTVSTTIAMTSWVTAWTLGSVIRFHPYSCALPGGRRTRRFLPWILNVMALLQWIAGVYVLSVYFGDLGGRVSTLQSYDCLVSQIPDAPGSSTCSAEDLCSKSPFFRDAEFIYEDTFQFGGGYTLLFYFFLWTLMALMPLVFLLIGWLSNLFACSPAKTWKEDTGYILRVFNLGPNFYLALASFISIIFSAAYGIHLLKTWDSKRDREGLFIFHAECNALHVPLSAWRDYWDLGLYARAFRIAKMVFNA